MANPQQPQGKPLSRAQQRAANRKKFIEGYLKRDRFVNVRTDQLRLIINEEQELYDFLDLMDKALMGRDYEKPEFLDKDFFISDEGKIFFEEEHLDLATAEGPRLEEAMWILTQGDIRTQINAMNRGPIVTGLITLVNRMCQLDDESTETGSRRHSMASIAALALYCTSPHWDEPIIAEIEKLSKESPFALVRSILGMGLLVVENAGTGVRVELQFGRGRARERFVKKKKDGEGEGAEETPRRRRRRRRRRRQ